MVKIDVQPSRYTFRDLDAKEHNPFMPIVVWRGKGDWAIHQGTWEPRSVWVESSKKWMYDTSSTPAEGHIYSLSEALEIAHRVASDTAAEWETMRKGNSHKSKGE